MGSAGDNVGISTGTEFPEHSVDAVVNGFTCSDLAAANENLSSCEPAKTMAVFVAGDFPPMSAAFFGWQGQAKRVFDVVGASAALVLLAPLLLLIAAAILAETRGPVLFVQQREGRGKVSFPALKFRTMWAAHGDQSGICQTVEGDWRVTRVGRFLRRTSIDELPQLFNVLWGQMSLVGPRPHVSGMLAGGMTYRELVAYYDLRLLVRPGLTGLAQASGLRGPTRNSVLARKRVDYDLAYIQNFNLWLDIRIIFMTLKQEFKGGSGY